MAKTLCILFKNNDYKGPEPERLYHIPREYFVCKIINRNIDTIGLVEEDCTVLYTVSLKEEEELSMHVLGAMLDIFFRGMTVENTFSTD